MRFVIIVVLAVVVVAMFLPSSVNAQQGLYDRPVRMRNLPDLQLIEGNDLTSPQKTEVLLSWLIAEQNSPSATINGKSGAPIDSNYLQAQIVKALAGWGDPTAVAWVANSPEVQAEAVHDCMILALGGMGDQTPVPALEKILLKNRNPYLRSIAADDLGLLGSISSIPVLKLALEDDFSLSYMGENDAEVTAHYPVRQTVEMLLRVFNDPVLLVKKKKFNEAYAIRLAEARKHPPVAPLTSEHFVQIANGEMTE